MKELTGVVGKGIGAPPLAKNDRMISVRFQGKPFNITVIQVYAPTSNAEEAEVERFYEDLQDILELTPQKDVLFMIGDWNAKVGSHSENYFAFLHFFFLGIVLITVSCTML